MNQSYGARVAALRHRARACALRRGASPRTKAVLTVGAALLLSGCESEVAPTAPAAGGGVLTLNEIRTLGPLNATSNDTLVHVSLATGTVVPATGPWDVAFRRFEVRLNSPATAGAATRNVTGFAIAENRSATNEQVLGFTPASTLAAFDQIRAAQIPADTAFSGDVLAANPTAHLNFGGVPTANATRYWKVRTADGGHALFRVAALSFTPQVRVASITFEVRRQTGSTLGPVQQVRITSPTAPVHVSLAAAAEVPPAGCNWDVQFNPASNALTLLPNVPCNVATAPGPMSPAFAAATSASDAPQYIPALSVLSGPIPNSITDARAPFRYNLAGNQRLHPAFNSYLVKQGTTVYKLQVINYYNETGASAHVTVRYARIR